MNQRDEKLTDRLAEILQLAETDMTIFYRRLANVPSSDPSAMTAEDLVELLSDAYYAPDQLTVDAKKEIGDWVRSYQTRLASDSVSDDERRKKMNGVNPNYVLRNYLAQLAIDKAESGDFSMIGELLDVLRSPYDEQPGKESFAAKRPEWARNRPGCSTLSCSS